MSEYLFAWLVVTAVGCLGVLYSTDPMRPPVGRDKGLFYAALIWFVAGLVGVVRSL